MNGKELATTNQEIIAQDIPPVADDMLVSIAERAERRIDALGKIKRLALKLTNAHDWVDQNGRPYLQASGAEKVARLFGISWTIDEPKYEPEESGHFSYTYTGQFTLGGATITAVGTRSSKDGFFKKYEWGEKDENGHATRTELPISEIDRGDVKKAAYTNLLGNGITRILGIRNLTYADLKEFAGLTQDMLGKVEYKKSGQKQQPPQQQGSPTITDPGAPASEAQIRAIYAILTKAEIKDEMTQCEKVSHVLNITPVITKISTQTLNKQQASILISSMTQKTEG